MTVFRERKPLGPTRTSENVAGVAQLSDEWHRRFVADLGNGQWDVVDVGTFLVNTNFDAESIQIIPAVELRVAHTLCADPRRPIETGLGTADVESRELPDHEATEIGAFTACASFDPTTLRVPEFEPERQG